MVLRENVQRRIVASCNVAGRDLGSVIDDIRTAVAQRVQFPAGYRVEYGGQFESQQTASQRLAILGGVAMCGLLMLLILAFGRTRDALIIMANLPMALIGGVAGVFLAGGVLSVASIIGSWVTALIFEQTGSWTMGFYGSAVMALVAAGIAVYLRAGSPSVRAKASRIPATA